MPDGSVESRVNEQSSMPRVDPRWDMRLPGRIPSLVCEGRPGFFQRDRLREPSEIHRGHKMSCLPQADRGVSLAPWLRTANLNL